MRKCDEATVVSEADGKRVMSCGCVWVGHSCPYENQCPDARALADAITRFYTQTDEGRARVAYITEQAKLNGGTFVKD
jgi:hypothetical protein